MKCDYCNKPLTLRSGQYVCEHCGEYKQSANITLAEKQLKQKLFQSTQNLIHKQAWYYAHRYNMEIEDTKSQAYLIFCEAVDRFDGRASFTTYLYHRLRTLNDYCRRFLRIQLDDVPEDTPVMSNALEKILFYQLADSLSLDSQEVMKGLLWGSFEKPELKRKRKVGKSRIREVLIRQWGWSGDRVERVWAELCGWWSRNREVFA